ncbi:nitroreductase family protein [Streptomyces sp. NPDC003077]|uniref:nitroreductase family protein n=1 Tax=Streptomyces sp. NPDC003077 TaxID=3154443 RepID=UPI0033BB7204
MTDEPSPDSPVPGIAPEQFLRMITTRSVMRTYSERPIAPQVVDALLQGMESAPNAANTQAWSFVVVQDPRNIRRLRSFAPGVFGVPALVVMACTDNSRGLEEEADKAARSMCVAMAVENLLLTAHAHGLGGCPVHSFRPEALRLLFDLPSSIEPVLLAPIGYPASEPRPSRRRARKEFISYETYGQHTPVSRTR